MIILLKDTVDHDGRRYEAGQALDLDDGQAKALVRVGVAELASEGAEPANAAPSGKGKKAAS
jgi:hypothetical protein